MARTLQIIATYRAQDIEKARNLRDAIKADGRYACIIGDTGRVGDLIVLQAEPANAGMASEPVSAGGIIDV
jgi:hypothetical protein